MTQALTTQPEYRALMMLNAIPEHCTAIMCMDERSLPHIRQGEWVVIDGTDRQPVHGELYVVRFGLRLDQQHICMVRRKKDCGWVDQQYGPDGWTIGAIRNDEMRRVMDRLDRELAAGNLSRSEWGRLVMEANGLTGAWVEGPYQDAGVSYEHMCDCIVGRIIGLYAPAFEEPKREARRAA